MAPKSSKKLIKFRQSLFWDVDPKTIDPEKNAKYIIERILEFGNDDEVRWMWSYYTHSIIKDRVEHSRGVLREKSKALWSLLLT
ncbi:MAG: Uncharacterized protein G01um101470_849 [Parcubacteria group bacterium Gr01-1014_70]|nr:MAG: Uncharacterized protein G01um101470_849 [Parcubacteria group bacterium Gr01-1014_70]